MKVDKLKGKLFGIGAGPGDPELLTIKAINAIKKCCVIVVPKTGSGEKTAFAIIEKYLDGKELLECRFLMDKDITKRKEARQIAANDIIRFLDEGKDVGFVTLGDPTTYSTYMYVHEIIAERGYDTQIIPGITSYAAAAAELGIALCMGDEALTIISPHHNGSIDKMLDYPGNKVIMKSGEKLGRVLEKLKECGYGDHTKIASHVSTDNQRLYANIEEYEKYAKTGYFTLAIVKEKG